MQRLKKKSLGLSLKISILWQLFQVMGFMVSIFYADIAFSMSQEQEMEEMPYESLSRVKEIVNNKLNIQYPSFNGGGSRGNSDKNSRGDNIGDLHGINEQVEQLSKVLSSLQKHVGQKIAMRESEERSEDVEDEKGRHKSSKNNLKLRKKSKSDNVENSEDDNDSDGSNEYSGDEKGKKEKHSKKKNIRKTAKTSGSSSKFKIYTVKKNVDKSQLKTNSYIKGNNTFRHKISRKNGGLSHKLRVPNEKAGQYIIKSYAGLDTNTKSQDIDIPFKKSAKKVETSKKCGSNPNRSLLHIATKKGKYTTKEEYFSNGADCAS